MRLFRDSFEVGAGATLGSIASVGVANMSKELVNGAAKKAYNDYRSQYFDPVVRTDLCDIMVKQSLPKRAYPFPVEEQSSMDKTNFFKRHKAFTVILILFVFGMIRLPISAGNGSPDDSALIFYGMTFMALLFTGIGLMIQKLFKIGGNTYARTTYKNRLGNDGKQYWYIREYIRQALETRQITVKEAVVKISNTRLAQQFPDTLEELDAHVFFYQQQLGLR